jgi:hypothetical protein
VEKFNYISFGNWAWVEGDNSELTMSRGRLFEYTPTDTEMRLESLDAASIAFIEKLPTFLCSEIKLRGGSTPYSMLIKYGRTYDMKVMGKEVSMGFKLLIDIGEVSFENLEDARLVFDADPLQLYRTHWAVRDGDASKVLARLAKLKPDLVIENGVTTVNLKPPPRNKKVIGAAESVEGFLKLLYDLPKEEVTEIFFRGHGDANYELTPSLFRKWDNGNLKFLPLEDRLCKELLIAHHEEFQADEYCFDRLVRMQHFKLPTRLLDISGNPLVALYFACSDEPNKDGEVVVFHVISQKVKYYDSDTVSCLSNLSHLTNEQKSKIDLSKEKIEFNNDSVIGALLHHIKSEKGFFESRIVPEDLGSIVCVKAKLTNSRIKSQSGAFLLFGHEATLPDAGQDGIEISRVLIGKEKKKHILVQLSRININATTVYPSIDQTAIHLRDNYQTPEPAKVAPEP